MRSIVWAMKCPGDYFAYDTKRTRKELVAHWTCGGKHEWAELRKAGYRPVKVELVEVK